MLINAISKMTILKCFAVLRRNKNARKHHKDRILANDLRHETIKNKKLYVIINWQLALILRDYKVKRPLPTATPVTTTISYRCINNMYSY